MRQRRTTPGRSVGKCIPTMTVAPDRESCSISTCGAERTNANEMQGAKPVVMHWPVRPPHHASPSALTLNTPKSPKPPSTSRISFAQREFYAIDTKSRKRNWISPEIGFAAFGARFSGIGNPASVQKINDGMCR